MTYRPLTVYKASAGSGKTFTLATEYIKLLINNPQCYRNILAVTFTNKATEEMKKRILSQLYGIWKLLPDSESYIDNVTSSLNVTRGQASRQAGIALSNLMHNYSYFRIETIDSFFQNILRNLARELDLTANLRISLNDGQVEEKAVDMMIQDLDSKSVMLNWIIGYITSKIEDDKSWNVIGQIKSFGKTIFEDYYKAESHDINIRLAEKDFFEHYIKQLRQIKVEARQCMQKYAEDFFEITESAGLQPDSFASKSRGISSYFRKLRSDDFSDKKCQTTTLANCMEDAENWTTKSSPDRDRIIALAEESLIRLLREAENTRQKQWRLYLSADVTLRHLDKVRLLSSIEKKVRQLNEDSNQFLLSDTQQLLNALTDNSDSPFIFEKIGTYLEHVMIDEFQDTSTIQWKNFKILLEETMSHGNARNLIVGDVKQSIYRWRSGDWRLLNSIEKEFASQKNQLDIKTLQTNYRSERNIIEFNNKFFSIASDIEYNTEKEINPEEAEELRSAYNDVCQKIPDAKKSDGMVKVTLLPDIDYDETMLDAIGCHIDNLLDAGISPCDIAILVRTNKHIPVIADYFMLSRPHIKIVSDEAFRLDASLAVTTVILALRFLIHPEDMLTKANLSKAYRRINNITTPTAETLNMELPEDYYEHTEELLDLPLTDLIERLYAIFHIGLLDEQSAYMCAFYDYLGDFIKDNTTDIEAFIKEWEENLCRKTIQSDEIDGIRLISIHKSKGLEFDNVIIPYCDWMIEMRMGNTLWCYPKTEPFNSLPMVPVDYSSKLEDTIYADDYRHEHLQNCVDNLNLLYVAFTRAGKNMFIIGKREAKNSRSTLIQQVLPILATEKPDSFFSEGQKDEPMFFSYGNMALPGNETDISKRTTDNVFLKNVVPQRISISTYDTSVDFRQSNKSRDFIEGDTGDNEQKLYIKMGNVLHSLFSKIRTTDDIPMVLRQLEFDGMLYDEDVSSKRIRSMLEKRLSVPKVRKWFSPEWRLFNECSIITIDKDGELCERRPDRVMTDGNRMIVVDFKFGRRREEYKEQIIQYMQLLQTMGYKNIQGFLWYVYSNNIEEVRA